MVLCSNYHILVFVESWLSENYTDAELSVKSFNLFRCDRSSSSSKKNRGGGVLIYVRDYIGARKLLAGL